MIYLRYFKEFSRKRSEVISDIRNHRTVLVEHILKLYYYRDFVECLDGWIEEVQAFLGEVSKIKTVHGKDRFPTPEEIYKEAWANDLDNIDNRHDRYISDFSKKRDNELKKPLPKVKKDSIAENFCNDYIRWVSEILSKKGVVTIEEVESEIEKLWKKYPYTRI